MVVLRKEGGREEVSWKRREEEVVIVAGYLSEAGCPFAYIRFARRGRA